MSPPALSPELIMHVTRSMSYSYIRKVYAAGCRWTAGLRRQFQEVKMQMSGCRFEQIKQSKGFPVHTVAVRW